MLVHDYFTIASVCLQTGDKTEKHKLHASNRSIKDRYQKTTNYFLWKNNLLLVFKLNLRLVVALYGIPWSSLLVGIRNFSISAVIAGSSHVLRRVQSDQMTRLIYSRFGNLQQMKVCSIAYNLCQSRII